LALALGPFAGDPRGRRLRAGWTAGGGERPLIAAAALGALSTLAALWPLAALSTLATLWPFAALAALAALWPLAAFTTLWSLAAFTRWSLATLAAGRWHEPVAMPWALATARRPAAPTALRGAVTGPLAATVGLGTAAGGFRRSGHGRTVGPDRANAPPMPRSLPGMGARRR
jgi:hypothetical protein